MIKYLFYTAIVSLLIYGYQGIESISAATEKPQAHNTTTEINMAKSMTPYQVLVKIREIENFDGGTYEGESEENHYSFLTPDKDPNRISRIFDRITGDVYVTGENGMFFDYNLFNPATYPKAKSVFSPLQVSQDQRKGMSEIEQKLYAQTGIFNPAWSPDYQYIAYYAGTFDEGEACVWKVGSQTPLRIATSFPGTSYFEWSPNSQYLLLDSGTSRHREGRVYSIAANKLSKPFGYISNFAFSPDSKWAAFSQSSSLIAKEKIDYEDEETEEIWLYDLSTFHQQLLVKTDDHTDYFPVEWQSNTTLIYSKHDYRKDTKELQSIMIP